MSWDFGTFRPLYGNAFFKLAYAAIRWGYLVWLFCLLPYFTCAHSEGSGVAAWMRRLAWAFSGRLCDKYYNLMSWLKHLFVDVGADIYI